MTSRLSSTRPPQRGCAPSLLPSLLRSGSAVALVAALGACSGEPLPLGELTQHLGGVEGTMEYAIDAPWRIEPHEVSRGVLEYGAIPLQVSIHDADIVSSDTQNGFNRGRYELHEFCSLHVRAVTS